MYTFEENRTDAFAQKNPLRNLPVLEVEDRTCLSESMAVCRYLEALYPHPFLCVLEIGQVEMWNRRAELSLYLPIEYAGGFLGSDVAERARKKVSRMLTLFDHELSGRAFIAGDALSVADITMMVALDSGAIARVANARDVPADAIVSHTAGSEGHNFVAANGGPMTNHGETTVQLETEDGDEVLGTFNIIDVTRPLHAATQMADQGNDILMNKGAAYVVPEGVVDRILREWKPKVRVKYPRRGGLYVARFRARAGQKPVPAKANGKAPVTAKQVADRSTSGFPRRGGR